MKQTLIQKLIEQLTQNTKELDTYIEKERAGAMQAPGRMESRYDSEKQEASYRANTLMERKALIIQTIQTITEYAKNLPEKSDIVEIGALITTQDTTDKKRIYFILPTAEGEPLQDPNIKELILVLSPQSPIFPHIHKKKKGDTYEFNGKTYTIIDVQ